MTNGQDETFTLLGTLGTAIETMDWPTAFATWKQLVAAHGQLAYLYPGVTAVLRKNATAHEHSKFIH